MKVKLDRFGKRLVQWAGLVSLVKYITIPDSHDEAGEVK